MRKLFILVLIVFMVNSQNIYAYDEKEDAVKYINEIRKQVNSKELVINENLEKEALNHSKYMYYNNIFSVIEEKDNKFYKGKYAWDRSNYFGYTNRSVQEFVSKQIYKFKDGIDQYLNNPYSRNILLDPLYQDIGLATFENAYTYTIGGKERTEDLVVTYPYDHQTNIPVKWVDYYSLDPYRNTDIISENAGLPITITFYSDKFKVDSVKVNRFILTDESTQKAIETMLLTPDNDKYNNSGVICLPLEKYKNNTTYNVDADIVFIFDNGESKIIKQTFSFKTEPVKTMIPIISNYMTRGEFSKELVRGFNLTIEDSFNSKFSDVDLKSNYKKYINTAVTNGIFNGYPDNTFRPEIFITREEAFIAIIRAYEKVKGTIANYDVDLSKNYTDALLISDWSKIYIQKALTQGLITTENKELRPQEYIKLSEFNDIINIYNGKTVLLRYLNTVIAR